MQTILLTGGTGFIGSHCCIKLLELNKTVIILDNLSNSKQSMIEKIQLITSKTPLFIEGDISNSALLDAIFKQHKVDAVIHMAGLKAVNVSVDDPLLYYEVNVEGSRRLIKACLSNNVNNFVFSSSATVYGEPEYLPLDEKHPLRPTNPYGATKLVVENLLKNVKRAEKNFKFAILRYFNPVGAHISGLIGEDPNDVPNNLMPLIAQVATKKRSHLNVYGNDYSTHDGTGVRDYIHIDDLTEAHLSALDFLLENDESITLNLGTGQGHSVIDMVKAFSNASGQTIPLTICSRRAGDVATSYTNPAKANALLNWKAKHGLERICEDQWRWTAKSLSKSSL